MLLVNSLLGSEWTVSGGFALTDCGALFLNPSLPTLSLPPFDVCLCVICVCAAEGKLQVTTGNSIYFFFQSLHVFVILTLLRSAHVCV